MTSDFLSLVARGGGSSNEYSSIITSFLSTLNPAGQNPHFTRFIRSVLLTDCFSLQRSPSPTIVRIVVLTFLAARGVFQSCTLPLSRCIIVVSE